MARTVVVKGHMVGPRTVELDEPVSTDAKDVEVVVQVSEEAAASESLSAFLRRLPPGTRSKEDIDDQIRQERDSWH